MQFIVKGESTITYHMFNTGKPILKLLAFLVWSSGAVVMYYKSSVMLLEAESINPGTFWIGLAILSGLVIGFIKAKYLFRRLCLNNLKRINSLDNPKLWNFFRLRFFVFLVTMIALGLFISAKAQGNYSLLIAMAIVELSIATALLGSISCFWKTQQERA